MKPIETERLRLRKFTEHDFSAVHSYASVIDNCLYMPWGPNTPAHTKAFIDMAIAQAEREPCVCRQYAVELKETGAVIGACDLTLRSGKAEVGWIVGREYWNQGLGTEMGRALLAYGFGELKLHRITARCDAENIGSYRIMEKIGMRREGLFLEAREAGKRSSKAYGDELRYAITIGEWETHREIAEQCAWPIHFDGFIDVPELSDGTLRLICTKKSPARPEIGFVPAYVFAVCKDGEAVGEINLRIGYTPSLYYCGQIGYSIDKAYRGKGYAAQGCQLLRPVLRAHGMQRALITNDPANAASVRVCEKLGAKHLRVARLPEGHDLYVVGQRFANIYEWPVD